MGIKKMNVFMVDGLVERLQGIDEKIVTLEGGAVDLSTADLTTNQNFADLTGRVTALEDATIDISTVDLTTNQAFSDLQTQVGTLATSVGSLQTTVSGLTTSNQDLLNRVATLEAETGFDIRTADLMTNPQFAEVKVNGSDLARSNRTLINQLQTDLGTTQGDIDGMIIDYDQRFTELNETIISLNSDLTQLATTGEVAINAFNVYNIDPEKSHHYIVNQNTYEIMVNKNGGYILKSSVFDRKSEFDKFTFNNTNNTTHPDKIGLEPTGTSNVAPILKTTNGPYYDFADLVLDTTDWFAEVVQSWTLPNGNIISIVYFQNNATAGVTELYVFEKDATTGELTRTPFFESKNVTQFSQNTNGRCLRTNRLTSDTPQAWYAMKRIDQAEYKKDIDNPHYIEIGANENENPQWIFAPKGRKEAGIFDDGTLWFIATFSGWGVADTIATYPRERYFWSTDQYGQSYYSGEYHALYTVPFIHIDLLFHSIEINGKIHWVWDYLGPTFSYNKHNETRDDTTREMKYIYIPKVKADLLEAYGAGDYNNDPNYAGFSTEALKAVKYIHKGNGIAAVKNGHGTEGIIESASVYPTEPPKWRKVLLTKGAAYTASGDYYLQLMHHWNIYYTDEILRKRPTPTFNATTGKWEVKFTTYFLTYLHSELPSSPEYRIDPAYSGFSFYGDRRALTWNNVKIVDSENHNESTSKPMSQLFKYVFDKNKNLHFVYGIYKLDGYPNNKLWYKAYRKGADGSYSFTLPHDITTDPIFKNGLSNLNYIDPYILIYDEVNEQALIVLYSSSSEGTTNRTYSYAVYLKESADFTNINQYVYQMSDKSLGGGFFIPTPTNIFHQIRSVEVIQPDGSKIYKRMYRYYTIVDPTMPPVVSTEEYLFLPEYNYWDFERFVDISKIMLKEFFFSMNPSDINSQFIYAPNNQAVYKINLNNLSGLSLRTFAKSGSAVITIDGQADTTEWMSYTHVDSNMTSENKIEFELRTSNDGINWTVIPTLGLGSEGYPKGRYLKITVKLSTTNEYVTPLLNKLLIKYRTFEAGATEGEVITLPVTFIQRPIAVFSEVLETIPDATSDVQYFVSLDDGTNWMEIAPDVNNDIPMDTPSNGKLRFKARIVQDAALQFMKYLLTVEDAAISKIQEQTNNLQTKLDKMISKEFYDSFNGESGITLTHGFGHQDFFITIMPKFVAGADNNVGTIAFETTDTTITVYNTGTGKNPFKLVITGYALDPINSFVEVIAPSNITHTVDIATAKPILSWDPHPKTIKGFNIYRDGVLMTPTPIAENTYHDTTIESGITYKYEISAVDYYGHESAKTAYSLSINLVVDNPAPYILNADGGPGGTFGLSASSVFDTHAWNRDIIMIDVTKYIAIRVDGTGTPIRASYNTTVPDRPDMASPNWDISQFTIGDYYLSVEAGAVQGASDNVPNNAIDNFTMISIVESI